MTLEDHETRRDIVNPYITLYSPENTWAALNTGTFGEQAQNELINLQSEDIHMRFAYNEDKRLYKVVATVGKQDHPRDYEERTMWTRGVRVSGAGDAIALVPLGHLLEDVVRKLFPASFEFFEKERKKAEEKKLAKA